MNKAGELERRRRKKKKTTVEKDALLTKKKLSPRNPLEDLNGSSPSISTEAPPQRKSCFSFLLSSSSSSSSSRNSSLPGTKPMPRTPLSAPPKNALNPINSRNPSRAGFDRPKQIKQTKLQKPKSQNPLLCRKSGNNGAEQPVRKSDGCREGVLSKGKVAEMSYMMDLRGNVGLKNGIKNGSCLDSTPQRSSREANARFLESTPEKEGEKWHSNMPTPTNTTPPIQASISPEIVCGPSVLPTPTCFAAGHLIAGIPDRRKCRPRGILKVGGGGLEILESGESLATPPLARASMQWLSPPCKGAIGGPASGSNSSCSVQLEECQGEASVHWLIPAACKNADENGIRNLLAGKHTLVVDTSPSTGCGFQRISPTGMDDTTNLSPEYGGLEGSDLPILDTTPSREVEIWRTPNTDSSISPFSMILKKAAASPGCEALRSLEEIVGNPYCSAIENSLFSEELLDSCFNKQVGLSSRHREESVGETVQILESSSPQFHALNNPRNDLSLSFQFGCTATASNSIDLTQFRRSPCQRALGMGELDLKENSLSRSAMRISWREGLVSRIFEMGELGSFLRLSNGEEDENCHREDLPGIEQELNLDLEGQLVGDGFGSVELVCDEQFDEKQDEKNTHIGSIPCSESMSIDTDGLVSSSDSDWTMFFKNDLFQL